MSEEFAASSTCLCADMSAYKAVVVGGGTGAHASIEALRQQGFHTDAVVAMADDGGSTGRLRRSADVTPPGDVRKCLISLAADSQSPFACAFGKRFDFADDHALGNLILSALERECGSFPAAIATCESLLETVGHAFPSTLAHVQLAARTVSGDILRGQAQACASSSPLSRIWLESSETVEAFQPAVDALLDADLIVLGPGSLFTSIASNLAVPGIAQAICASKAQVVFVCSLADMQGETAGMSASALLDALSSHGLAGRIDAMLVDECDAFPATAASFSRCSHVVCSADDRRCIQEKGVSLFAAAFSDALHPLWHDPAVLGPVLAKAFNSCRSRQK